MELVRYYQTGETTKWIPFSYTEGVDWETLVRDKGAKKATILALTRPVDDFDSDFASLRYIGPFYMDIDVKPEEVQGDIDRALEVGIQSVTSVVNELVSNFSVPKKSIHVFLSGKKGFHLTIPNEVFGLVEPCSDLPRIYNHMASYFMMPGVDYQVYSSGKGVSWRLTEIIREGTDIKRTRISLEDLKTLTPEIYQKLVRLPSTYQHPPGPHNVCRRFRQHFERARLLVKEDREAEEQEPLTDDEMEVIKERPPCVTQLISNKDLKVRSFNGSAMQVMIYLARTGQNDNVVTNTISRFVDNRASSRFGSSMEAKKSLKHIYSSVKRGNKRFGCGYIRSTFTVPRNMCKGCALTESRRGSSGLNNQLELGKEGTYLVNFDTNNRMIVFPGAHITPESELTDVTGDIVGMNLSVRDLRSNRTYQVSLEAEEYVGPTQFIRALRAKGVVCGANILKCQADILAWFQVEIRSNQEIKMIDVVEQLGLYIGTTGKGYWITPEKTWESNGMTDTVHLHLPQAKLFRGSIWSDLKHPNSVSIKDKELLGRAILASLTIRDQHISGTLMGWMMSCWLNPYLKTLKHIPPEFPILRMTGTTGTGKSTLIQHFVKLTGLTDRISLMFGGAGGGSSIVGGSHAMASSKSLPIIWEEVNATGTESGYHNKLKDFLEAVKNSWNGDQVVKSTGVGTTGITAYAMTNPVVLLGEVDASTESLNHRCIWLYLDRLDNAHSAQYVKAYEDITSYKGEEDQTYHQALSGIADFMFFFLASKDENEVRRMILEGRKESLAHVEAVCIENGITLDARKRTAIAVVLQGIDLLVEVMLTYQLAPALAVSKMAELKDKVIHYQLGVKIGKDGEKEQPDSAMTSKEQAGKIRLTDGEQLVHLLLGVAEQDMRKQMLLNRDNFRPCDTGERGLFTRESGYLVINATLGFSLAKKVGGKDSLNFAAASLPDFRARLWQLRDKGSPAVETTRNEIALNLEMLDKRGVVDVDSFEMICSKYLDKLYAYNPDISPYA